MALKGIRVVEFAGLAPVPFCGMILSDFGANVIRVDKAKGTLDVDRLARGKRSISIDLKHERGLRIVRKLCSNADVLIEPYRKGVMERLGLSPDLLLKTNPRLIYARLTGFGQSGSHSMVAGHDINFIAIAGLLSMIGRNGEKPTAPINLLGDFAGGGLICALGIVLALFERSRSGLGQVIDANMVEGAAYVGSYLWTSRDLPIWGNERGKNLLDTGAHNYDTYETKDGKYVAVGALEPQFYSKLVEGLGLSVDFAVDGNEVKAKKKLASIFTTKTRDEWVAVYEGTDSCVTPVLDIDEAVVHPHNRERETFVKNSKGCYEPRPAPILKRTPGKASPRSPIPGQQTEEILREIGYSQSEIKHLEKEQIVEINNVPSGKL